MTQKYQYVQVESENSVPLIDSRVYCRDIIQVVHKDWMQDTFKKYQAELEAVFGVYRVVTDKPLKGSLGGRPERYLLMTEAQCNALLSLSKNTKKVREKKYELIADFERAKAFQREYLERQLQQSTNIESQLQTNDALAEVQEENRQLKERVNDLEQELEDFKERNQQALSVHAQFSAYYLPQDNPFPVALTQLWEDSGIAYFKDVENAVTRDFVQNVDWEITPNGGIRISRWCYTLLMLNFRSDRGVNYMNLPKLILVPREKLIAHDILRSQNTRNAHPYTPPEDNQLHIF